MIEMTGVVAIDSAITPAGKHFPDSPDSDGSEEDMLRPWEIMMSDGSQPKPSDISWPKPPPRPRRLGETLLRLEGVAQQQT
jgi:hypothetical protein